MTLHNINIMLADDDKDDCLLFREALEELSISANLAEVNDGQKLIQQLTNDTANLPDILFLDLNMPRKNGFACLTEIKGDKNLRHLPVIILSTSFDERVADLLYQNGAHFYICKPADFSEIKNIIHQVLVLTVKTHSVQPPREKFLLGNLKSTAF